MTTSAASPRARRFGIVEGPSPIDAPSMTTTVLPLARSKPGMSWASAALKAPDVMMRSSSALAAADATNTNTAAADSRTKVRRRSVIVMATRGRVYSYNPRPMRASRLFLCVCAVAAIALSAGAAEAEQPAGPSGDAKVTPGELVVEHPTLINLGFEWRVEGDANRNAGVDVSYRKQGETAWRQAMPLVRLHGEQTFQRNVF